MGCVGAFPLKEVGFLIVMGFLCFAVNFFVSVFSLEVTVSLAHVRGS